MDKKATKKAGATPRAGSRPSVSVSASGIPSGPRPFFLSSGFEAANDSPNRGYLYFPTDDTRRQWTELSHAEIRRRVHWLVGNFGFANRMIDGLTKFVGTLTPQPITSDEAWNKEAFDSFRARAGSPELFDMAGRFDFWGAQRQANRSRFRDGDHLTVLTETQAGGARFGFYEGHQITGRAALSKTRKPDWRDHMGVRLDRWGKHLSYQIRDGVDPSQFSEISARNAIYLGTFKSHGQTRGQSILTGAVCNMIDIVESRGFTKVGIKERARVGTVIERDLGQVVNFPGGGMTGPLIQTQEADGKGGNVAINWEAVYAGASVPRLAPGEHVRVVADGRPHPNQQDFEKALMRDCSWTADFPYEVLCDISGLTGPGVRSVLAEVQRWLLNEHHLLAQWCQRVFVYFIAREIKEGRLRAPSDEMWYLPGKTLWIGQPDMTIDLGRDGALSITQLGAGMTTFLDEWGERGAFWQDKIDQKILETSYIKRRCAENNISPYEAFPTLFPPPSPPLAQAA